MACVSIRDYNYIVGIISLFFQKVINVTPNCTRLAKTVLMKDNNICSCREMTAITCMYELS